jgi:hypothetical protein
VRATIFEKTKSVGMGERALICAKKEESGQAQGFIKQWITMTMPSDIPLDKLVEQAISTSLVDAKKSQPCLGQSTIVVGMVSREK